MMGKIVFYGAISLDGYLATKEDSLQWLFDTPTGEKTTYEAFYQTIDQTIMGRKTYESIGKPFSYIIGTDIDEKDLLTKVNR